MHTASVTAMQPVNFGTGHKNVLVLALRQTSNGAKLDAAEVSPYPDSAEAHPGDESVKTQKLAEHGTSPVFRTRTP